MRRTGWKLLALGLTVCLLGGCAYLPFARMTDMYGAASDSVPKAVDNGDSVTISKEDYERYQQFDTLLELIDLVDYGFYEEADRTAMIDGAASGLLSALGDPYTFYYTPEDYAKLWEDDEGAYAGVGIQISASYLTGICTISRVFDNGPAREAGVHKGDILYQVEDLMVDAYNLQDAVDIMRGVPGTMVHVVFLRDGEQIAFDLERASISVNRVEAGMLTDEVGYISLYEFSGDCATRFETALNSLREQGAKGLIIDLRDNPGGWVEDAEAIADLFLDEGVLCYLEDKNGNRQYYRTKDGRVDLPIVLLANENSASSSEILMGALKERANATVVGVQSYGKGIVQNVIPVGQDGAGMQMTIAQYYTPNGNKVHKVGITPDVEIDLPEGDNGMYEFGDLADPQLKRALEEMQKKLAD